MDFHVGSLADLISQKTRGKAGSTKLFQNVANPVKEVRYKVIPTPKRKLISDQDEDTGFRKRTVDGEDTYHGPKLKRFKQDNALNAAKRLKVGKLNLSGKLASQTKEKIVNPEEDKRTIFVGNLPCHIKVKELKKLFKSYGEVESARLRCPPVKDPRIPKRVAAIKKEFHPDRTNIVGYVRFSSEEEAVAAIQSNGLLYKDHHLRVDLSSTNGSHDQKKAVFVGNVHFGAEENDLWKAFEHCGEIDSVRVVRDSQTGVGKGFAYINFKDLSSVELALKMDGQELKDRAIRVKRAVKKVKVKKESPKVMRRGPGQKFKGVGKGKFSGKGHFREDKKEFEEKAESFPRFGKKGPEQKFKRGGKGKFVSKEQSWNDDNEFEEKDKRVQKVNKKPKLKFEPRPEKKKPKLVKKLSEDGPSFLGNKMDEQPKGKIKKKKLSKADLKKKVLAFQLQLRKSGISNQ